MSTRDTNLRAFSEHKSKHWIQPGSKLFHFVDILKLKVFQKGICIIFPLHKSEKYGHIFRGDNK